MSRTLQSHHYSNLRQASCYYTPAHSKDGKNISQKITVNCYANYKRRDGQKRDDILTLTAWGKAADILALTLTDGKLFSAKLDYNTYQAPVYDKDGSVVQAKDGSGVLMRKASGWTIDEFALGEDAFGHINTEIQANIRGRDWWVKGSADAEAFNQELKRRMTLVGHFDPVVHKKKFGFADVTLPKYTFGAYVPEGAPANGPVPEVQAGQAATADTVAAAFAGGNVPTAKENTANFAMPQGV
jgi:hypothetical protein